MNGISARGLGVARLTRIQDPWMYQCKAKFKVGLFDFLKVNLIMSPHLATLRPLEPFNEAALGF